MTTLTLEIGRFQLRLGLIVLPVASILSSQIHTYAPSFKTAALQVAPTLWKGFVDGSAMARLRILFAMQG